MKMKAIVIATGMVGSLLIIYGSIAQSSAGIVGLFLAIAAIISAGCFRRAPRSGPDERGAKVAVIASILGNQ